jgi:hypothetical protein
MIAALPLTAFWHIPVDNPGKSSLGLRGGCSSSAANAAGPPTASRERPELGDLRTVASILRIFLVAVITRYPQGFDILDELPELG